MPHPAQWCPSNNVQIEGNEIIVNVCRPIMCAKGVKSKPYIQNLITNCLPI